jgi:hypothetical protein
MQLVYQCEIFDITFKLLGHLENGRLKVTQNCFHKNWHHQATKIGADSAKRQPKVHALPKYGVQRLLYALLRQIVFKRLKKYFNFLIQPSVEDFRTITRHFVVIGRGGTVRKDCFVLSDNTEQVHTSQFNGFSEMLLGC